VSNKQPALRIPEFMALARSQWEVAAAAFPNMSVPVHEGVIVSGTLGGSPTPPAKGSVEQSSTSPTRIVDAGSGPAATVFPAAIDPRAMGALERKLAETTARVDMAVERLRSTAERVAVEARADALEVALLVARRIVEAELTVNLDAQVAFIRTAIRRLGEARTITVRVAPAQAEGILSSLGTLNGSPSPPATGSVGQSPTSPTRGAAPSGSALSTLTAATVEVVGDPSLGAGDCMVESELASVDGRVDTRLEEVRRAVLEALASEDKSK
jgi:hypothetical protein